MLGAKPAGCGMRLGRGGGGVGFLCFIPRPFLGLSPILHPEVLVVLEACVCVQGVAVPPHFSLRFFPLGTDLPSFPHSTT